jgi:acetolactate synthase-1/2/3 large subunit
VDAVALLRKIFFREDGILDALACAELMAVRFADDGNPIDLLLSALHSEGFDTTQQDVQRAAHMVVSEIADADIWLTGAEAVAFVLECNGVQAVFAYAGTSELALCDSADRAAGLRLMNGRGDKESAFMAAGASLLEPNRGAAILHGARGLTNAAGAIADARRNEAGTLFIVGLPSTSSAQFLPPHGEAGLMASLGGFTDWWWESPAVPDEGPEREIAAHDFVRQLTEALTHSARLPARPSMFGIPQDVSEQRWIPLKALWAARTPQWCPRSDKTAVMSALTEITSRQRPLFLIDDYALRYPGLSEVLDELSRLLGAPVLQVRYRRGPMLFERLRSEKVGNFIGWLNQFSDAHAELMAKCDVLITVEDRNIYRRVVGDLPCCRKIALTGDASKARKNGYLLAEDLVVEGHTTETLRSLTEGLKSHGVRREPWFPTSAARGGAPTPEPAGELVEYMRTQTVGALAHLLQEWDYPVLVDDSQMFGGLISERYDLLPPNLRVFGGHGGFVGGGLGYAVGLAIAHPRCRILCTLGDQAFTNSFQGLVAAVQEQARVLFVVCNNGESVSLKKQAAASDPSWFGSGVRPYLCNAPGLEYHRVAEALGVPSRRLPLPCGPDRASIEHATTEVAEALVQAARIHGPALVELLLPADPEAWRGIWLTQGFEQRNLT